MRLGADDINACRALVQWIVRGIAVLCVAAGILLLLKRLLIVASTGWFDLAFRPWDSEGESNSLYMGLALVVVGAALAISARRLSKWIVVLPSSGCPRCGHARPPGGQDTRCPECGQEWRRA
jgi:hypothetical protein